MHCWFTWHCLGMFTLFCLGGCCHDPPTECGARSPGDVLIAMLFPCHSKVDSQPDWMEPENFNCTDFDPQRLVRALAVIHTIDTINDAGFLPGVRLGYLVCDTCAHATKAIQISQRLLSINGTLSVRCDLTDRVPVKAVIGSAYSEVSITVARLLGLHLVPQISTSSSAEILSDDLRFPSFLRTIPGDKHQTRALARLMAHFNWTWVGVVSGDDDYGQAALVSFSREAKKTGLCLAFSEKLPHNLNHPELQQRLQEVAKRINASDARVVLLILKDHLVAQLFQQAIQSKVSRIWIGSDTWSMSRTVAAVEGIDRVGHIFGLSFMTGRIPGFEEYLRDLRPGLGANNSYIEEYKRLPDPQKANDDFLVEGVNQTLAYGESVATWAIAHALRELLQCNETFCSKENFPPWKLLRELKRVNFTLDNRPFYFNGSNNFLTGYQLNHWVKVGNKIDFKVVGEYNLIEKDVHIHSEIDWGNGRNMVPESKCSKPCAMGEQKKVSKISCCYNCTKCEEGTYSDEVDSETCRNCSKGMWSGRGWSQCVMKKDTFLEWNQPFPIVLLTSAALGETLLFAILVIFIVGRESPAVKVAGGWFCYVMIIGLAASFGSVVLFVGRPNYHICRARQTMYGLGFTLCLSCVLVKAFRTFLAFLFDLYRQHKLSKYYNPIAIITLATGGQGLVCLFWLIFDTPRLDTKDEGLTVLLQCHEGSQVGFGVMHCYAALLAAVCFVLAMKGRKVPHRYNETGYIIFSVLIYLFVWMCFIPVYVTRIQERSAVQAAAILASNFGMVFCHFLPKCYMILCKKKVENSREAYLERVQIYSITSVQAALARRSQDSGLGSMGTLPPTTPLGTPALLGPMDFSPARGSVGSAVPATVIKEPQECVPTSFLRKRSRRRSI